MPLRRNPDLVCSGVTLHGGAWDAWAACGCRTVGDLWNGTMRHNSGPRALPQTPAGSLDAADRRLARPQCSAVAAGTPSASALRDRNA
jgi:hypothetical protein